MKRALKHERQLGAPSKILLRYIAFNNTQVMQGIRTSPGNIENGGICAASSWKQKLACHAHAYTVSRLNCSALSWQCADWSLGTIPIVLLKVSLLSLHGSLVVVEDVSELKEGSEQKHFKTHYALMKARRLIYLRILSTLVMSILLQF